MGIEIIIGLIVFFFFRSLLWELLIGSKEPIKAPSNASQRTIDKNMDWLEERWKKADADHQAGDFKRFKGWYFDQPTERQIAALNEKDLSVEAEDLSKGVASDLLGLFESVDEADKDILRFFKMPLRGMNQTQGRHQVAELMDSEENRELWQQRPAQPIQKEFYRYFGFKIPQGLTYVRADEEIRSFEADLFEQDNDRLRAWEAFYDLYDEITDTDTREAYGLKKVSLALFRDTVKAFEEEGIQVLELENDSDMFIDRLLSKKPELRRADY